MSRIMRSTTWTLVSFLAIFPATTALSSDRSAEQILKELDSVQPPKPDAKKVNDQEYMRAFAQQRDPFWSRRAALILELYKAAPRHPRIPQLMAQRWRYVVYGPVPKSLESFKEIDEILAKDTNPDLKIEGTYIKAVAKIRLSAGGSPDLSSAEEFIKLAPKDDRCAVLLRMAGRFTSDEKKKAALEDRAIKEYPDSPYAQNSIRRKLRSEPDQKKKQALEDRVLMEIPGSTLAKSVVGERRRRDAIGKPFDLEFVDAIQGSAISIKRLKGTVVVIDFWATWCGPCVAEMPHMKELYAKYHDRGVELIGISLDRPADEGGLDRLKEFVKEKGIGWPQFYRGDGGMVEFAISWGIRLIPAVFVVDADGNLFSGDARDKLDTIIPELLEKKRTATNGTERREGK